MKNVTDDWTRLAGACVNCRDELRGILPRLDQAIRDGTVSTEQLEEFRRLVAHHAEALKAALKSPATPRSRRNALSSLSAPLWHIAEAAGDATVEVRS